MALIAVYLLVGFVLWHWGVRSGSAVAARRKRETAGGGCNRGRLVGRVPVHLTALLAVHRNRPDIGFAFAAGG